MRFSFQSPRSRDPFDISYLLDRESNTDNTDNRINNKDGEGIKETKDFKDRKLSKHYKHYKGNKITFSMANQGLITSQDLQGHYDIARFGPEQNVETDTLCLWMAILHGAFRSAPHIHCVREFPSSGRRRSAAKAYQFINNRPLELLYVEFEKSSFPHHERDDAAKQVTNHCLELLQSDSDMQNIVAGLCHGTEVAFWLVDRSTTHPSRLGFHDAGSEGALGFRHQLEGIIQENADT